MYIYIYILYIFFFAVSKSLLKFFLYKCKKHENWENSKKIISDDEIIFLPQMSNKMASHHPEGNLL